MANEIIEQVRGFLVKTCKNREETHGVGHMEKVAKNAQLILDSDYANHAEFSKLSLIVMIAALLHDVADHKYDHDGKIKTSLIEFIDNMSANREIDGKLILKIIDNISYSKENKAKKSNHQEWVSKLELGELGQIAREIVSDADKLEAIGLKGIDRCREYILESKKDLTESEVNNLVIQHALDKLLRLKDEFIVTKTGKKLAEPLHNEMLQYFQSSFHMISANVNNY